MTKPSREEILLRFFSASLHELHDFLYVCACPYGKFVCSNKTFPIREKRFMQFVLIVFDRLDYRLVPQLRAATVSYGVTKLEQLVDCLNGALAGNGQLD